MMSRVLETLLLANRRRRFTAPTPCLICWLVEGEIVGNQIVWSRRADRYSRSALRIAKRRATQVSPLQEQLLGVGGLLEGLAGNFVGGAACLLLITFHRRGG